MNLPLHQILPGEPVPLYSQHTSEYDDSNNQNDNGDNCILASCRILPSSSQGVGQSASSSSSHTQLRMHSLYPLAKVRVSDHAPAHVLSVHPYGSTNLLFLIIGKDNRKGKGVAVPSVVPSTTATINASYKIALWDDRKEEVQLELTFKDPVLNLLLRRDKLVVVLERRVVLFHLDLANEDRAEAVTREGEYETVSNPLGLASIATTTGSSLLALPGRQVGHVQLIRLPRLRPSSERDPPPHASARNDSNTSAPPYPIVHIYLAHESALRTVTLSKTGSLLCTSSNKGTLLRVFSTSSKNLLRELRRGTDQADIWSVAFEDPDKGGMIACASDKRTVHIWKVGDLSSSSSTSASKSSSQQPYSSSSSDSKGKGKEKDTPKKAFNLLKPYLPAYFSSQWSDLTWRIPHNASVTFQASHIAALNEQDDVATCFFVHPALAGVQSSGNASSSLDPTGKDRKNSKRKKKKKDAEEDSDPFYLLVITRSGAWYKLSVFPSPTSTGTSEGTNSTSERKTRVTIQEDRNKENRAAAASSNEVKHEEEEGKKCRLVVYKRIGYGSEGEEDDEAEDQMDSDSDTDSGEDSE